MKEIMRVTVSVLAEGGVNNIKISDAFGGPTVMRDSVADEDLVEALEDAIREAMLDHGIKP